ncbi:MAG: transposase [Thermoplasmata archaeon]
MHLSYQYRIYPLSNQLSILNKILSELTFLWNHSLADREDAWGLERRPVAYLDQQPRLREWRGYDRDGLGTVAYSVAQGHLQRLDMAYREFFRRVERRKAGELVRDLAHPRFHRETTSFSYQVHTSPLGLGPQGTCRLTVPGLGKVPLKLHRSLPDGALAKSVTVAREGDRWFATVQVELPNPVPPPSVPPTHPVGIDLGLTSLATLSDGTVVEPPKFFLNCEKTLARQQRILSRRESGSHRYRKQRLRVAKYNARVKHQRKWFLHQLSHDWSETYDMVAFEDLDASEFREGNPLAKGMADAGWGILRQMTKYKQALRSHHHVEVAARGTTQTCSNCGRLANPPLTLKDRTYTCPCGHREGRDLNASRNILARGLTLLRELRATCPEVMRVEEGPPPRRGRRAYLRRRAPLGKREEIGPPPTDAVGGRPGVPVVEGTEHVQGCRMRPGFRSVKRPNPRRKPTGRGSPYPARLPSATAE